MVKEYCVKMKKTCFLLCMLAVLTMFMTGSAMAGGMRWPIGISYVNGFTDLADQYEDNLQADGYSTLSADPFPVGISFQPYYQWDDGLRIGVGVGPIMIITGDVDHFQLPFSVTAGYTFMPDGPVSPYVKAGPSYHFASGDDYEGSNLGFVAGVGIEFLKSKKFAMGLEAVYDSAEVDIDDRTTRRDTTDTVGIKAAEFVVSLLFRF
ncbi:outer membrane beta-barrel protein [Planctomycetota bacterium]